MKKTIVAVALAMTLLVSFAGCSGGKTLDHAVVAQAILDGAALNTADLVPVNPAIVENYYPGLTELSDEFTIYINGSGGMVEEIAVINAKEGASAADIKALVETRIERQRSAFVDYVPTEIPKLDNAVIKVEGSSVVVLISGDSAAKAVVDTAVKG